MAKGNVIGGILIFIIAALGVYLVYEYFKSHSSSSKKKSSSGAAGGGGSNSGQQQQPQLGIGPKLFNAFVQLTKYFTQGQTIADLTLGTASPTSNALIPSIPLQQFQLPSFPLNIGAGLASLGSIGAPSLSTTDLSTSALIPTQPLQSFDMSGISFPANFGS